MKVVFTIAFAVALSGAAAQELQMDSVSKKWMYQGVIKADSAAADALWSRARQWVATSYREAKDQVRYENKEEGKIVVNGRWAKIAGVQAGDAYLHTLTLETKDGRLRYTFTDLVVEHNSGMFAGSLEYMENTAIKKNRKRFADRCAAAAAELERVLLVANSSEW